MLQIKEKNISGFSLISKWLPHVSQLLPLPFPRTLSICICPHLTLGGCEPHIHQNLLHLSRTASYCFFGSLGVHFIPEAVILFSIKKRRTHTHQLARDFEGTKAWCCFSAPGKFTQSASLPCHLHAQLRVSRERSETSSG